MASRLEFDPERFSSDPRFASKFVAQESPFVYKVCRQYAVDADHAADLHQASWERLCRAAAGYRSRGAFRSWFYKLIRSVCVDDYKQRRKEAESSERYADELRHCEAASLRHPDPLAAADEEDQRLAFDEAVETLPRKQRQVVLLRLVEKKTTNEVADELGVSPATVRSHLSHAVPVLVAYMRDRRDD